jgi:regulator of cell morphogenesis and NO signaling
MIDPTRRLADLVTAHPSLARELERRGLDYCCGGSRTLAEACAARELETDAVVQELVAAGDRQPVEAWTTMDARELVDHIEARHHRYLWDELPRLTALMDKVGGVHGRRHPELHEVARSLDELRAELEPHLRREERVLFPMIRALVTDGSAPASACGSIHNPISVMMAEHDHAGELLARLRRLTGGYQPPADACSSYTALYVALGELEADTHLHVHKENNILFPMVAAMEARTTPTEGGEAPCHAHLLGEEGTLSD